MPNTKQTRKRVKTNNKRKVRNKAKKSSIKTELKNFDAGLVKGEIKYLTQKRNLIFSLLDKSIKSNIYTKNKIAHIKSKISKKLNNVS